MKDLKLYKVGNNYFLDRKKACKAVLGWKGSMRGYVSDKEIIESYVDEVKLSDIIVDFPKKIN